MLLKFTNIEKAIQNATVTYASLSLLLTNWGSTSQFSTCFVSKPWDIKSYVRLALQQQYCLYFKIFTKMRFDVCLGIKEQVGNSMHGIVKRLHRHRGINWEGIACKLETRLQLFPEAMEMCESQYLLIPLLLRAGYPIHLPIMVY